MPLSVGSSATKSSSQYPTRERRQCPSPRYHPYKRSSSYQGSSTSHRETHSRRTNLAGKVECHDFLATVGDLGIAQPNEDSMEYAARMAARVAKAEDDGVVSLFPPSLINPITHLSYHEPEWATTLALLKSSPLLFANSEPPTPSLAFAAAASVGPHSPVQPVQFSPPSTSTPIQPANVQVNVESTDREKLAQRLNEYLETHPEPIVGSIDNPFSFAEKYGVKGVSILNEHVTIDDALEHQRFARHFSERSGE